MVGFEASEAFDGISTLHGFVYISLGIWRDTEIMH